MMVPPLMIQPCSSKISPLRLPAGQQREKSSTRRQSHGGFVTAAHGHAYTRYLTSKRPSKGRGAHVQRNANDAGAVVGDND
jgi:hypothetical protein